MYTHLMSLSLYVRVIRKESPTVAGFFRVLTTRRVETIRAAAAGNHLVITESLNVCRVLMGQHDDGCHSWCEPIVK